MGTLPHLLLGGWYKPGSGFTRVLQALVPHLRQKFQITWLGVGYQGPAFELAPGVHVLPTNLRGGDLVGAYDARRRWASLAPDLVLVLNDLWYLQHYANEFALLKDKQVPMVGYLPLDGGIDDAKLVGDLTGFTQLVTYTEWAADQLRQALKAQGQITPVSVAGHGVDLSSFFMQPDGTDLNARMARAQALFGLSEPAFVVLNASRPDPRKRLDLTLDAFALFARDKPTNVRLCLHQAIAHELFVRPLREQAAQLGIEDRILWYPPSEGPLDDDALNTLYNACAVGLNTAMGEGFGLVSFEHAATGAPQVLPAHPALLELWQDQAELVTPVTPTHFEYSPLLMGAVDARSVAASLDRLHQSPDHYAQTARACLAHSQDPQFQWSAPAKRLIDALCLALEG
jgi:D-inositol-3-phosphate glycosyltransferase